MGFLINTELSLHFLQSKFEIALVNMFVKFEKCVVILLVLVCQSSCQPTASRFILKVAHYIDGDLDTIEIKCVASVVTERHVLTTATCVSVEPTKSVAIVAEVSVLNFTETSKKFTNLTF